MKKSSSQNISLFPSLFFLSDNLYILNLSIITVFVTVFMDDFDDILEKNWVTVQYIVWDHRTSLKYSVDIIHDQINASIVSDYIIHCRFSYLSIYLSIYLTLYPPFPFKYVWSYQYLCMLNDSLTRPVRHTITYALSRSQWNGYYRWKWTRQLKLKSIMRMFASHKALMPWEWY